ncbi:B-box zinc finger protein 21 [Linum grandiflorum]
MKIQCDVCSKEEAAVFCTADEAALCDSCDHRVHHANKLASKHLRFSLHLPSPKSIPLCDICQEKRAFLFCQQDRAILCQDCDVSIHSTNEFTRQHTRFLLTGVKLSSDSAIYISSSSTVTSDVPPLPSMKRTMSPSKSNRQPVAAPNLFPQSLSSSTNPAAINNKKVGDNCNNNNMFVTGDGFGSSVPSTMSDYLMEMLPGWQFDNFLDTSSNPFGFSKSTGDHGGLTVMGGGGECNPMSSLSSESSGIWVPQNHHHHYQVQQQYPEMRMQNNELKETKDDQVGNAKPNKAWTMNDAFTVPQITPPSVGSKRSRLLW